MAGLDVAGVPMRTHVDLFSGIGGFALACAANGVQTVSFCEIDERCRTFLAKAWPGVDIHDDVRTFDGLRYRDTTWLLTAGVPCQPASRAGKQRGSADDRWLWPEAIRVLSNVRSTWALFENPPGIGDVGLAGILSDLEGIGYEVRVFGIPACAVGAPHRRERYWIVCHAMENTSGTRAGCECRTVGDEGRQAVGTRRTSLRQGDGQTGANRTASTTSDGVVADAGRLRCGQDEPQREPAGRDADWRDGAGNSGVGLADAEGITGERGTRPVYQGPERQRRHSDTYSTRLWTDAVWVPCADGKFRRAPDDTQRVAYGLPVELLEALAEEEGLTQEYIFENAERFGDSRITGAQSHRSLLGALGNSIVPQVAQRIIAAMIEAEDGRA